MPRSLAALLALAGLLAAAPVPKGPDAPSFFPTKVGTSWVYRTSGNPGLADFDRTWYVTAVEKRGAATLVAVGLGHKQGWMIPWGKKVVSGDGLFEAEPFDPPLPLLRNPPTPGRRWMWEGTYEKQKRSQTRTVRGSETVSVPAGKFTAVKVETVETRAGQDHQFRYAEWYARDVGRVKVVHDNIVEVLVKFTAPKD